MEMCTSWLTGKLLILLETGALSRVFEPQMVHSFIFLRF
jgi:hypothetical protein